MQAWEILQRDSSAVLLDVRSSMEYEYVGHPCGAVHIPLMEPPDWQPIEDFADRLHGCLADESDTKGAPQTRPILAICRSGQRSRLAMHLLRQAGFQAVSNVLEGFEGDCDSAKHRNAVNGWRFHKLPWEQS